MKNLFEKKQKVVKGTSSAVILSILIHAGLFLLAGMFVVFTVVKQKEVEFEPPKAVERPKMKLKKPKVKVRKSSKPKPTTRIVTKVRKDSMPDIQLPEMSGMAEGLDSATGGFDMMPDLEDLSVFGSGLSVGNDFVGTFYDFNRDRTGRPISMSPSMVVDIVAKFVSNGWKAAGFSRYYHSSRKLYTTTFMVAPTLSQVAPSAFGESDAAGYCWVVLYKGKLVHKDGITFRFRGEADDILVVRVDGKIVLGNSPVWSDHWQSSSADNRKFYLGQQKAVVGDWITLEPGVPLDMEVLIGELPGVFFYAMLLVEEKGKAYPRNYCNGPTLPMFKTAEPSLDLIEEIRGNLVPGEASLTNGPVFRDYSPASSKAVLVVLKENPTDTAPEEKASKDDDVRTWTCLDGRLLEAKFVIKVGDKVVVEDSRGKQRKLPLAKLSKKDQTFIELARPPKFNIDFSKQSSKRSLEQSPWLYFDLPRILDYTFSAQLKQISAGEYNHELQAEFFAIGEEIDGDNYILLDRQKSSFTPTKENQRAYRFRGKTVALMDYKDIGNNRRGEKYGGYLVVVTDSQGKIIDYGTSHKWLFGILEKLRELPIGKHFDKTGMRVDPPRPKPPYVPWVE